jgi:hypothetical protein
MQTRDFDEAAEQLAEYLTEPSKPAAPGMVRLAAYVSGYPYGRGPAVCTTGADGRIVSVVCDRGWFKI